MMFSIPSRLNSLRVNFCMPFANFFSFSGDKSDV